MEVHINHDNNMLSLECECIFSDSETAAQLLVNPLNYSSFEKRVARNELTEDVIYENDEYILVLGYGYFNDLDAIEEYCLESNDSIVLSLSYYEQHSTRPNAGAPIIALECSFNEFSNPDAVALENYKTVLDQMLREIKIWIASHS